MCARKKLNVGVLCAVFVVFVGNHNGVHLPAFGCLKKMQRHCRRHGRVVGIVFLVKAVRGGGKGRKGGGRKGEERGEEEEEREKSVTLKKIRYFLRVCFKTSEQSFLQAVRSSEKPCKGQCGESSREEGARA
jgi:hypothetical protein